MRSSAKPPSAKLPARPRRPAARAPAPKPYHHGDLRRVLIDAALQLVGEGGPDAVSVREAARRAGVSPGAPFRHFPSRDALMNAVAEEAQRRFRAEIEAALAEAPANNPLGRFRCLGLAYLRWAMKNPTHFEIISSRRFFDHDKTAGVSQDNAELIDLAERTLAEAFAQGQLRSADLKQVQIAGRALVYGFARMNIDGHFPRWGVAGADAERTAEAILDLFIEGIAKVPSKSA
ncbi:TetR/AcrR family transcriptional regulator [Bradyrhizobium sp. AUGA SZCCT0240]|jgi:AcrR family transcriptional regulator|uniref:TetR/AcrR family transcriptional regulator n=1 Tax=unclassified Bradyrhizobium TaxID=2631580 RepID=UPI001BA6E6D3|nr:MULTISPECIES: TetR/AcrR family transcriptional regulator [unclassified Bradyrhizobium]MBR1197327.1 TetR/AcrR family transcriptional regulator [Bradyrhizobium sp. AUGA SZCCT0158]MBR1239791.1 TetR/AcrR family transcriptional regulator [Bradyrhizobium sp. AUGA SZCCT0274]MBR1245783.1 TetR/AcrR family transcriptional regulator [Bradyrhizobium sp. AUGA SZCCT0169]MBR1255043.1 TetR/AcrR family transcriptional regulator [Bradyrhizobium sp. AUGA SZCCT0240]